MRRLIVMRHAKSDWDSGAETDHERPLNKRGRRDAPKMAAEIESRQWTPEWVVSSDSRRTTETWERMQPEFSGQVAVQFTPNLYHAGIEQLASAVAETPDGIQTVLALGHNPGWEAAVAWLSDEWETMTTANAALLEIDEPDWPSAIVRKGGWQLVQMLRPKELG